MPTGTRQDPMAVTPPNCRRRRDAMANFIMAAERYIEEGRYEEN